MPFFKIAVVGRITACSSSASAQAVSRVTRSVCGISPIGYCPSLEMILAEWNAHIAIEGSLISSDPPTDLGTSRILDTEMAWYRHFSRHAEVYSDDSCNISSVGRPSRNPGIV